MIRSERLSTRRALPSDKADVFALCNRISDGSDYILKVWDRWILDNSGEFVVATLDGKMVGLYHLSHYEEQSWMEALRVDTGYRRRGIATNVVLDALERIKQEGKNVLRLVTSMENLPSRNLFTKLGFAQVLHPRYRKTEALPRQNHSHHIRMPEREEVRDYLESSGYFGRDPKLISVWWRWWEISPTLIDNYLRDGLVIASGLPGKIDGLSLLKSIGSFGYRNALQISFMHGRKESMEGMLSNITEYERERVIDLQNSSGYFAIPPKDSLFDQVLDEVGFAKGTELVVMEKKIKDR